MSWFKKLFSAPPIENINSTEWQNKIKSDPNSIIIDVRSAGEFASGYIPKALNADIFNSTFSAEVENIDKQKTLYVYCRSGKRSMMACRKLYKLGFENLVNLNGGIMRYDGPIKK